MDNQLFDKIYKEIYNIWEIENKDTENQYLKREWIFPNHINLVIKTSRELAKKYEANEEICLYAALFHDIGLVYKREKNTSPKGHEKRSIEFTKEFLKKHKFNKNKTEEILNCIQATQTEYEATTIEEKIVSTADFISQFNSIHYFAKAVFANDMNYFIKWFKKRIEINFEKKIYFDEIKIELEPIRKHYLEIIKAYEESEN